jgi:uncharacterized protein (TIGR03083 family)
MLSYERYCVEIVTQTDLLASLITGSDLSVAVPSCPGWTVNQLVRHLGGGQRWGAEIVRTRASAPPSDDHFRDLSSYVDEDPVALSAWLRESGQELAAALADVSPTTPMWGPVPGSENAAFFARRFTHETVMHRADAFLPLRAPFELPPEVGADALAEWMELESLPIMFDFKPEKRELLGPGRTIHLHATDAPVEWVVDLTGDLIVCREGHEKAAVAMRGPLTDLLLVLYGRKPVDAVEVLGDGELLTWWLKRVTFG